jgi:hypothetical protein
MRIARDLGFDALSNPGESAVIMNRVLFNSEGVVQAGLNEFFMMDDEYIGKFAVQVQEPVTGEYFCFGLDGERLALDDLLNAGVLSETNPEVIAAIKKLSAAPTATDLSTPAVIDFDGEHEAFLISGDTRDFERNQRALTQAVAAFNERALEQVVEAEAGTVVKKARPDDESELGM